MRCPVCLHEDVINTCDPILSKCCSCSHIWETELAVRTCYDQNYILSRYDKYPTTEAMSFLRLGLVKSLAAAGRLLDVGYGNGSFVKLAQRAGFNAYGNDVHGADYGVREAPLNGNEAWEVVTFFDSLEHFHDLELVRSLGKRAGHVVVSFPARPVGFPIAARLWKHFRPGEHLHYFTLESLQHLFTKPLVVVTDLEDTIRGRCSGSGNITTAVFGQPRS